MTPNKIKTTLILIFIFLIVLDISYGSYSVASPGEVTVEKGSSKEFSFQIQAYRSEDDLSCGYSFENTGTFNVSFEESTLQVNKKSFSLVKGILRSSKETQEGKYSYSFCIECLPKSSNAGTSMNLRFCGIPLKIEVFETKPSIENKERMADSKNKTSLWVFAALGFIFVFLAVYFVINRKIYK